MKWVIAILLLITDKSQSDEELTLLSKSRTQALEEYFTYVNVVIMHFEIPEDVSFASFKLRASELQISTLFSCAARTVELYMKLGSPPVLSPDKSTLPKQFKDIVRPKVADVRLKSDNKTIVYLNLTNPEMGCYYLTTFLPFKDHREEILKPDGMGPECDTYVDVELYTKKAKIHGQISENGIYVDVGFLDEELIFKFYTSRTVGKRVLSIMDINFAANAEKMTIRLQAKKIPQEKDFLVEKVITAEQNSTDLFFEVFEEAWHYVTIKFTGTGKNETIFASNFTLYLKALSAIYEQEKLKARVSQAKISNSNAIEYVLPYRNYELVRESTTETFSYSYELQKAVSLATILDLNLTYDAFTVLQFELQKHVDIGGILSFWLSFNKKSKHPTTDVEKITLIACVSQGLMELPIYPQHCIRGDEEKNDAPVVLNGTDSSNSSMMIPFPEAGTWFVSLKIFCGVCKPCNCPNECEKEFNQCVDDCQINCQSPWICNSCSLTCKQEVVNKTGCEKCDCEGPCIRNNEICNTSVVFDLSAMACVGNCGRNGRCMFIVSDGIVFATCMCYNNYKGWDCSDGSMATPYNMVVLELLLLVLSNLVFLPAVFFAYRRKYYVEAVSYFASCFFSTFYHACDAGENLISFCITRLSALQFADFFCALLAIWVTLIAIANLPQLWNRLAQMTGAIIIAFTVTIGKTALWVFLVPAVSGFIIVILHWGYQYYRVRKLFVKKRYLACYMPMGLAIATFALLMFAMLETPNNYKYVHSAWHVCMALAVMLLLPREDTFLKVPSENIPVMTSTE